MKKLLSKKTYLITMAAIAAIVICIVLFAPGGDSDSGGRTFFGGMLRGTSQSYWNGGQQNVSDSNTASDAEIKPVAGPGTQNGVLGGSYVGKKPSSGSNGDPGSTNGSGDNKGVSGRNSGNGAGNDSGGSDDGSGGSGTDDTTVPSGPTVTLSIDAKTYRNGYIIMPAKVISLTEGETVFDVLYRECRANKIHMSSRWTPIYNSYYIEAIDNLYEFDCGELSGWMYSVNDWFPNYGCSAYKLEDGDIIAWRYTCDLGRDIGGGYAAGQ